jgi:hypothetical protein
MYVFSVYAQKKENTLFDKLDFNQSTLKSVEKSIKKNHQDKALKNLLKIYREKENLYLQVGENDVAFIKEEYPKDVEKTIEVANQVLDKFFLFRYEWDMEKTNIPYQFKGEIDWSAIPNGDEEWCFMLNRHRFWVDLGKAYLLTGEEKYVKGFVNQVTHWIDNNPLKDELKSLTWRRIEAGIRLENWIKSFEYMKNSKHITPVFLAKFLGSLNQHSKYLNSSFNFFSQTSNWGVIEFQGLFNAAVFLKEFKKASIWRNNAITRLAECIKLQVLEDGTHWEQSPMYHNEVFHCYLNVNLLAIQNQIKLPKVIVEKTKEMALANVKWQKPNFHQPVLGDSDDTDLRGLLTLATYIYQDEVLKSRSFDMLDYENYFILGSKKANQYKNIKSKNPEFLTIFEPNSGDLYMRTSWNQDATYSSIHLKKLGCGHGHDNLLHFNIFANGKDYLADGGRYTYVNNKWRAFFKSSLNHNTLGVDNLPNSVYESSWTNSFEARSQGIFTKSFENIDYVEAENTAYKRLKDPVSLKRRMLFLKPNVWLFFDSFIAKEEHKYSQYFNFPNTKVKINNKEIITTYNNDNLIIEPINKASIVLSDSWYSAEYNLKIKSLKAEVSNKTTGFSSFITLLYFPNQTNIKHEKVPVYDRRGNLVKSETAEAVKLIFDGVEYILFVKHNAIATGNHFYKVDDQFVSGEVVLVKKVKNKSNVFTLKN